MARIRTTGYDEAEVKLKKVYDDLITRRGQLADVHQIQSLNPESLVAHMDLYMTVMFGQSPLSRVQREMMAVGVSSANGCLYCVRHHREALNHYWKDRQRVQDLAADPAKTQLSRTDEALCEYARLLTLRPGDVSNEVITALRDSPLDESFDIGCDTDHRVLQFCNRIVLSMGVESEPDGGKGYNY